MESAKADVGIPYIEADVQYGPRQRKEECETLLKVFKDEPNSDPSSTTEAHWAANIESFLQDESEEGVILEDFREALNSQLRYYKRRIMYYKLQCDKLHKDRDEAEKHVRLIETEVANVVDSGHTSEGVHQAVETIRAAVQKCAQELKDLEKLVPNSPLNLTERETSDSDNSIESPIYNYSRSEEGFLRIINLVHNLTQSIRAIIKVIPAANQRLKERDLEIERAYDQVRAARSAATYDISQPNTAITNTAFNHDEVDRITVLIQSILQQTTIANKLDPTLERNKLLLPIRMKADPTDQKGAIKALREDIARREAEKEEARKTTEENKAEVRGLLVKVKSALGALGNGLKNSTATTNSVTKQDIRNMMGQIVQKVKPPFDKNTKLETESVESLEDITSLQGPLRVAQDDNNRHELEELAAKNDEIRNLKTKVKKAKENIAECLDEAKEMKKNHDAKIADLEAKLKACLSRYSKPPRPPVISPTYIGGSQGPKTSKGQRRSVISKKRDDESNDESDAMDSKYLGGQGPILTKRRRPHVFTDGPNYESDDESDAEDPKYLEAGQGPKFSKPPLPHVFTEALDYNSDDFDPELINKRPVRRLPPPRTPRGPPPLQTPRAPGPKKRKLRELERLTAESIGFQSWSTKTRKTSRPGF